jgi:hypothetical protein
MITRRSFTFIALALALATLPAAAHADKAKPKSSVPKVLILLTDGAENKTITPTVQTTFTPPKGTTAATACKGKVTASVPIGKKTVKKKKKTIYKTKKSSLKNVAGICTATSALKISDSFYGKTLKFSVKFPGNDAVKKFTKSSKFTLVSPPPPPAPPFVPTTGPWTISQVPGAANSQSWTFTMGAGGAVPSIRRLSDLTVACTGGSVTLRASAPEQGAFDTPFAITTSDVTATDHYTDTATGGGTADATSTFTLHFDSAGHATGTFRLAGTLVGPQPALAASVVYAGCDTGPINIDLTPGRSA